MDTKTLLAGLIGFFAGGLLVAIAATTFNNDELHREAEPMSRVIYSDERTRTSVM